QLVRLEAQSRSKSKSVKSKPQSVRASRRKSSSDSGYHRRAKLPPNIRVYKGNKDPKDHLSIFSATAEQEEWHMPRKPNEGLKTFMDRFKAESAHGLPPVLRISAFMHGHSHPELAKKLNDKIPKMVDEMWERARAFIRGEMAANITKAIRSPRWEKSAGKASWSEGQNGSRNRGHRRGEGRSMGTCAPYARREGFTPLTKTPKEILAMDNVNFPPPPPMVGTPKKRNMNKFLASGRLAHLVKNIRQGGQKSKGSAKGKEKVINMLMNCPMVVEAMIEGFRVRRIHVDGGEVSYPMGVIDLEVTIGECGKTRTVIMEFAVVKSPSPYNAILDRTGMRSLGAVASTIHSMMKFPTSNGISTISTTRETLRECRQIEEAQDLSRHARITDPTPVQTSSEVINPRVSLAPVETHPRRPGKEPMQLDDMEERRQLDKKRSLALDRRKVVADEVNEWLKAGIVRRVRYPTWVANPVLVKKVDGSWRMYIDFKDLNKACPKDLYPLLEIDWKIESLMGFQYKCFLDAYNGYHQIQMTKKDEEGVFCYTKMPFGLKNAGVTY
ncbi:hypothetical protein Tco_1246779, partial [Tanacetum coccineum]